VRPPDGRRYQQVSEQLFTLLRALTPVVEPVSVDEAFMDLSGCERLMGSARDVALELKGRVRAELGLTASVGVAPNKFLAKLASDLEKPDGLTVILEEEIERVLPPLPVERLWGVGAATAARLNARGVRTIGDLRGWTKERLEQEFGRGGEHFYRLARGLDTREVVPDSRARSISQERTFPVDVEGAEYVREVLRGQGESVARRLRKNGLRCRKVGLKIRYGDFLTISRSCTLKRPTDLTSELVAAALELFDRWARCGFQPVRLIGCGATALVESAGEQLDLFPDPAQVRNQRIDSALDEIQDRFGGRAIQRGREL